MKASSGMAIRGVVLLGALGALGGLVLMLLVPREGPGAAQEQFAVLPVFAAPSHIPPGESWVIVGFRDADVPQDLAASALSAGVAVLEVQRLSSHATALRLQVVPGVQGKLVRLTSTSQNAEAYPDLYLGQAVPSLSENANISAEDLQAGPLLVAGQAFLYAYFPAVDVRLSALRIHNRQTGLWWGHELAEEAARKAAEPAVEVGPAFKEVDPFEALPDTDGDQLFDFQESPEEREPLPEQLGVELVQGANVLDLVAVDERGATSWWTLQVFSTYVPGGAGL